jgi:hypothetical protein
MPRQREDISVQNVREQISLQTMFDKYGVRPIYLTDYAVASQADGYEPLRDVVASGRCEIGAHLQSWETPPFVEELGDRTSFNHNLPGWLQKEKLLRLTEAIATNIGVQPTAYRGGRYGIGEEIAWILEALNYQIDLTVLPGIDLRVNHGPDFRTTFNQPYWFGRNCNLLEIPLTAGFFGPLSGSSTISSSLYHLVSRPQLLNLHLPGLFARLGLFERITLTPEGISLEELKRLTRVFIRRGHRVFVFSYHSSSLIPGNTPYVRSTADLAQFIARIEAYFDFFFDHTGGVAMTPTEFRTMVLRREGLVRKDTQAVASVG